VSGSPLLSDALLLVDVIGMRADKLPSPQENKQKTDTHYMSDTSINVLQKEEEEGPADQNATVRSRLPNPR
jgi:hypothetical protein